MAWRKKAFKRKFKKQWQVEDAVVQMLLLSWTEFFDFPFQVGAGHSERDCESYLREMENCVRNLESIGIIGKSAGGRFVASFSN